MIRKHWRDPRFWAWWWDDRVGRETKTAMALVVALVCAFGGFLAASALSSTSAAFAPYTYETTVLEVTTLRSRGKVIRKEVPVVRTVPVVRVGTNVLTSTQRILRTVTTKGRPRVLTTTVERRVPVVRRIVVTAPARTRTVGQTVTNERTVTNQQTVTNQETVTNQQTVTAEKVVTNTQVETRTVTNEKTVTDTRTVTNTATQTVTSPPATVTTPLVIRTVTQTVTETVTEGD